MRSEVQIREATPADMAAVTAIYAESVANGRGTFELEPPDEIEMTARFAAVQALGLPRLVAVIDGGVVGYAYAGPFRTRQAYRYMVEDSIYVTPEARGRGVAGALLDALPLSNPNRLGARGECGACGACGAAHEPARVEEMPSLAP